MWYFGITIAFAKVDQTWWFGGNKSRNKVSVGEPAEGSLMYFLFNHKQNIYAFNVLSHLVGENFILL